MLDKIFSIKKQRNHVVLRLMCTKMSFKFKPLTGKITENMKLDNIFKDNKKCSDAIIKRIRKKKKCRVVFYVFEIAKWKTDTLYRLMEQDDRFEPLVVLGFTSGRSKTYTQFEKKAKIDAQIKYFNEKCIKVALGYDLKEGKNLSLEKFNPDIIFYQQHVGNDKVNSSEKTKHYALGCYVPYNVPNYGILEYDYNIFCAHLYRFYTLNSGFKDAYNHLNVAINNVVAVGHTALDYFYLNKNSFNPPRKQKMVIYAPHFSIMHPAVKNKFYYSTFNYNGQQILEFAKKHPEIRWVFKPHPNLIESLKKMNVTQNTIADYWQQWREIGIICETSDYYKLFLESDVMITDCASFLTEYFVTGKPLIHIINPVSINWPIQAMCPMFDTFYKVHDNKELVEVFEKIIIKNIDDNFCLRQKALSKLNFSNQYAAENIMSDLISSIY